MMLRKHLRLRDFDYRDNGAYFVTACSATDLSRIMQAVKSLSTLRLKREGLCGRIWQRGYFDRIIRNDHELEVLRFGPSKLGPYTFTLTLDKRATIRRYA